MLVYTMKGEIAALFYHLCTKYHLDDEESRGELLLYMARRGLMDSVVESKMTSDEYCEHLKKNFDIKDMRGEHNEEGPNDSPDFEINSDESREND